MAQLAAVSVLMEKVKVKKARENGEDIEYPTKPQKEGDKNAEDSSSSGSSEESESSSEESSDGDDLKKKPAKKGNGLNLISEESNESGSGSNGSDSDGSGEESAPDKEVNEDSGRKIASN